MALTIPGIGAPSLTTLKQQKSALSATLSKNVEEQMDIFQKLFLTQVENQSILNPMSTNDLTQNILSFNSAAQQARMNDLLEKINANHIKEQASAAKNYLNKEVEYQGREFTFEGGNEEISFLMPDNIKEAKLAIVDDKGQGVAVFPISTEAGGKTFSWNGSVDDRPDFKVPTGQYQVAVLATNKDGATIDVPVTLKGTVRKIGYYDEANEFALLVKNTPVEMSDISSVRKTPSSELLTISEGIQKQNKLYDELAGYLKKEKAPEVETLTTQTEDVSI